MSRSLCFVNEVDVFRIAITLARRIGILFLAHILLNSVRSSVQAHAPTISSVRVVTATFGWSNPHVLTGYGIRLSLLTAGAFSSARIRLMISSEAALAAPFSVQRASRVKVKSTCPVGSEHVTEVACKVISP